MFAFKNTAFLASLVTCGVVICSAAYYAQSTAIESGMLSDKQLGEIYGGSEIDCDPTDVVEGCAPEGTDAHHKPSDEAQDWTPPKREDYDTDEAFSEAYLASRPACANGSIETVVYAGKSAIGEDREAIEGDDGEVVCSQIWPITRSGVKEKAIAKQDESSLDGSLRCESNEDYETHCVVCKVGDSAPGSPRQKYECPEDNGG